LVTAIDVSGRRDGHRPVEKDESMESSSQRQDNLQRATDLNMPDAIVLTLVDGVRIVVPDSLFLITPYVLREQRDFFEDELPFVRQLLQPGQRVIDIGANYGVYTLPMAQKVGACGHVWAFEPASSTAQFLARGIAENGFGHVTLEQKAMSSAPGSAQLAFHAQAELRSIVHSTAAPDGSEKVSLVTLDDCMDRFAWQDIELIKIDAEGEEANIVKGGRRFFATLAPLVQYELRSAIDVNFELIRDFGAIGYNSYRLLPGLNLLVPFDAKSSPDPYLLNLFCCNTDRADRLAARGLLLRSADMAAGTSEPLGTDASLNALDAGYHWRHTLAHLPYAAALAPVWEMSEKGRERAGVHRALSLYVRSRDSNLSMVERFRALEASFLQLRAQCEREPVRLRLASLARVANDYGERAVAVNALTRLVDSIRQTGAVDTGEPFLAPLERFDSIAPGETVGNWILGAVLEQLERRERFSSFYAGPSALERLEVIQTLGFGSPEMGRRLELVRLCIAQATAAKGQRPTVA
jgi:FkbM family methyltransferase